MKLAIQLKATNDRNRNPRRGDLILVGEAHRSPVAFVVHGFRSREQALREDGFEDVVRLDVSIQVSPAQYNAWVRAFK